MVLDPRHDASQLRRSPSGPLRLVGLHYHLGRHLTEPALFTPVAPGLATSSARIEAMQTGRAPAALTVGGGFTQGRDPFFRNSGDLESWPRVDDCFVPPIEELAEALCAALATAFDERDVPRPILGLEPGRYITASPGVTLTRVGTVKETTERRWVMVDVCITQIGMSRSPHDAHAIVVADAGDTPEEVVCDVVGPLCVLDVIMEQAPLPAVRRDALLAILDTGAYADGEASNANSIGRPAVVLVEGERAELIRRRESFADVFGRDSIPSRLAGDGPGSPWHEDPVTD